MNQEFIILTALAALLSFVKSVRTPLELIATFFHELSHGIACILTFGKIERINLNGDGSGVCTTTGGFSIIILMAGYAGASAFGFLIYYAGKFAGIDSSEKIIYGLLTLIIFATLMWVRSIKTLLIMLIIGVVFYFPLKHDLYEYTSLYLKFIGIYIAISALKSPLDLIGAEREGDGYDLFKKTLIPEFIWILAWVGFGLYCLYNMYLLGGNSFEFSF